VAKRTRPRAAARSAEPSGTPEPSRPATPVEEAARVAERLSTPTVTSTRAGLPRRVPAAHLVPGAFSGGDEPATAARSAEEVRSRLDDYQDGVRRARQAAGG
jgi:hypothetical protein